MIDHYGRNIDYLRISVTDLCNLRCVYCMPEAGVRRLRHNEILRVEEIEEIAVAAASLGIEKIRITGGEPLIRRSIVDIVRRVAAVPGIKEVALTTNAVWLPQFAEQLKEAGLARVNVSIDTLDPDKYREITRGGEVADVLRGIEAAIAADLTPIKLNAVLMGGVNEDAIRPLIKMTEDADFRVRFIEVMPIGECAGWNQERFIGISRVLEEEPGLQLVGTDGVSKLYRKEGSIGSVGLISPISSHFCPSCNKIRVTSDGKLKPCLHSAEEIPLKGLHGEELTAALRKGILDKPYKHRLESKEASNSARGMSAIGG
jgi:cyclic pyranopterin phosphate synthase